MRTRATHTGDQHGVLMQLPHHRSQAPEWFSGIQADSAEIPVAGGEDVKEEGHQLLKSSVGMR